MSKKIYTYIEIRFRFRSEDRAIRCIDVTGKTQSEIDKIKSGSFNMYNPTLYAVSFNSETKLPLIELK